MTIGEKVKGLREQIGMAQGALAAEAKISQGYLSQIENDSVKNVGLPVAFGLAEALGVTIYDLVSEQHTEIRIIPELEKKLTVMSCQRQRTLLKFLEAADE